MVLRLVLSIGWLDIPAVTLVHRSGLHVLHLRGVVLRHRSVILLALGLLVVHLRSGRMLSVMLVLRLRHGLRNGLSMSVVLVLRLGHRLRHAATGSWSVSWSGSVGRSVMLVLGLLVVHLRHRLGSSVMLRSVTVSLDRSLVPRSLVVVAATIGSGCVTVPGVLMAFASVVGVALDTVATVGAVWVGAAGGVRLAVTGRRSVAHRVLRSSMGMVIVLRGAIPVSVTASGRTMILVG